MFKRTKFSNHITAQSAFQAISKKLSTETLVSTGMCPNVSRSYGEKEHKNKIKSATSTGNANTHIDEMPVLTDKTELIATTDMQIYTYGNTYQCK